MDFFSPGNIVTLLISVSLIVIVRQMDRNNRSIEKAKKFGDRLKDELDAFIRERQGKLEESSVALDVQQAKAVAAVKRLEAIRGDIESKEASLLERNKAVESFGRQIEAYDATIRQLLEMTNQAENNLSRITSESDFADNLGKKLLASQRQLQEITAAIPLLREEFSRENRAQLETAHADVLSRLDGTISDLERRIDTAHKHGTTLVSESSDRLKDIFQKAYADASKKAEHLEDAAFQKLKEQASERLQKYRETIEEKTRELAEQTKARLTEVQHAAKTFRADWQAEAAAFVEETRSQMKALSVESERSCRAIAEKVDGADKDASERLSELSASLTRAEGEFDSGLDALRKDVEFRMNKFEALIADADRLESGLRAVMSETESRVTSDFASFATEQESRREALAAKTEAQAASLAERMGALESGLNELKSRAYENVSEKLKVFEDDFFADLARRGEAITSELDNWKANVDERLASLSARAEEDRRSCEDGYAAALKQRLADIAEAHGQQSERIKANIDAVEAELRRRTAEGAASIASFMQELKASFEEARVEAMRHAQSELAGHGAAVQELLRKQEREVETRTKAFVEEIENARADAESSVSSIKSSFASWQERSERQLEDARILLEARIASFADSSKASIADIEAAHQSGLRDFIADTAEERKALRESIDSLKADMSGARADFDRKAASALEEFSRAYEEMTAGTALRVREHAAETDQTIKAIKTAVQELRDNVDQTRERLFQKVQGESDTLAKTIAEIDRSQKAFVSQTRVFERADELRSALEASIAELKGEVSRFAVYQEGMDALEAQYAKVRKLEEEASQKMSRVLAEKKRIDSLESDFSRLMSLSDSVDKKVKELTLTGDDLQQYQLQIRRFEESLTEANARFERLEKKGVVLDQTVSGVDRAFEGLKDLEGELKDYRARLEDLPGEIDGIKLALETLLSNKDKTDIVVERLSGLDDLLSDVEKRTEKMQTAREWLARTETRLEEISKKSEDQLKLLADILKDDGAAKKAKGAPPIGIRENVVKLAHQGWKVDEIARALHLSRGEVELILELPQK
jgi:DNA repair exonuclease SbcCD ATPase subunit